MKKVLSAYVLFLVLPNLLGHEREPFTQEVVFKPSPWQEELQPEDVDEDIEESVALFNALDNGNVEEALRLIDGYGPSQLYIENEEGELPINVAAQKGYVNIVGKMLDRVPALVNEKSGNRFIPRRWTPLHAAADAGQTDVVTLLLDRGANISARDEDESTPLQLAIINGHVNTVQTIIDHSRFTQTDLNAQDEFGYTALHYAAEAGNLAIVKLLLNKGANPFILNKKEETARQLAENKKHFRVVGILRQYVMNQRPRGVKRRASDLLSARKRRAGGE